MQKNHDDSFTSKLKAKSGLSLQLSPNYSKVQQHYSARALLRSATDDIHQRMHAHRGFSALAAGTITTVEYQRLLQRSFGFYKVVEHHLDVEEKWSSRLLADLDDLGVTSEAISRIPLCEAFAIASSRACVIGASYVLIGASLGGKVMARANASRELKLPFRFFNCPVDWPKFLAELETELPDFPSRQIAAASAYQTFSSYEQWMAGWMTQ